MRTHFLFGIMIFICFSGSSFAGVSNITKISELSQDSVMESDPCISDDELAIYYHNRTDYYNPASDTFMEATRSSTSDPFSNITSGPFTNVISATGYEITPWVSSDRLRLYFSSNREGLYSLYFSERATTGDNFSTPIKMSSLSLDVANDKNPRLANNELSIYFMSDRYAGLYPNTIFNATRTSISSDFDSPVLLSEISDDYTLFDISEDELTLILKDEGVLFYSVRSATIDPFPTPQSLHIFSGQLYPTDGSLSGDLSKIYLGRYLVSFPFSFPITSDLYSGDVELVPIPTATPILPPSPVPDIKMVATRDQIAAFTGDTGANPWGGAFDSQGRYIFFDQKTVIDATPTYIGTNQLIRLTPGSPPTFTSLATQAQLAAVDSRWGSPDSYPYLADLAVLSDDSVVLIGIGSSDPQRLLRIVPGNPPQITTVANIYLTETWENIIGVVVDKSTNPNTIYIATNLTIYSVPADQIEALPPIWFDLSTYFYVLDIAIDTEGNILFPQLNSLFRIDKTTQTETEIILSFSGSLIGGYEYTEVLEVNPVNGEIFGLYYSYSAYPGTDSYFNFYNVPNQLGTYGYYIPENYLIEEQIFEDPDIISWYWPLMDFKLPGRGLAIHPSGSIMYCSNGRHGWSHYYMEDVGTRCIISIGTTTVSQVSPSFWRLYE